MAITIRVSPLPLFVKVNESTPSETLTTTHAIAVRQECFDTGSSLWSKYMSSMMCSGCDKREEEAWENPLFIPLIYPFG